MPEQISRRFEVDRGNDFIMHYYFTTFSFIWEPSENPVLQNLFTYLQSLMIDGVPISAGQKSVSGGPKLLLDTKQDNSHDLVKLAADSDYDRAQKYQHTVVQRHLLANDGKTIATEIPVWDDEWRGHIDGIRWHGDHLEIFDFKPNAHKETKAASQIHRYRNLLSKRCNIPLDLVKCCYFDDRNCYFLTT